MDISDFWFGMSTLLSWIVLIAVTALALFILVNAFRQVVMKRPVRATHRAAPQRAVTSMTPRGGKPVVFSASEPENRHLETDSPPENP